MSGAVSERRPELLVRLLQAPFDLFHQFVALPGGDAPFRHQPLGIDLSDRWMLMDSRGHHGLGVRGLVLLVVAEPPVADEIDEDVVAEPLAERHCEANRRDRAFRVVGIHVDDR